MRGDRVEVVVDTGDGSVRGFRHRRHQGRPTVEVSMGRGTVEVSEVTRTGQTVRSARFMASRVVALVEHPATGEDAVEPRPSPCGTPPDQPSLELG